MAQMYSVTYCNTKYYVHSCFCINVHVVFHPQILMNARLVAARVTATLSASTLLVVTDVNVYLVMNSPEMVDAAEVSLQVLVYR